MLLTVYPGKATFTPGKMSIATIHLCHELKRRGFTKYHDGYGFQITSIFDEYLKMNVRDFQKTYLSGSCELDGIPGPLTWKKLFDQS